VPWPERLCIVFLETAIGRAKMGVMLVERATRNRRGLKRMLLVYGV
jgi:hypothetical protein